VGGTLGKGLEAALGRANPQDGGDDKDIGSQDEHNGGDDIGSQEEEQHSLVATFLATSQLHQGWDITEKVINYIVTAEVQRKIVSGDDNRVNKATKI
jgi:hypothetical protein